MWSSILRVMYYPNLTERNLWTIPSSENGIVQTDEISRIDTRNHLMQFTGLKDKNGTDIYEGDILDYPHREVMDNNIIDFKDGGFCLTHGDGQRFYPYNNEIIGNIYENPELIERGQEKI